MADDGKRHIPPGSCTRCGHKPHDDTCRSTIRTTAKGKPDPCPCARHEWAARPREEPRCRT